MLKKNKYDILLKKIKDANKKTVALYFKFWLLKRKFDNGKYSEQELDIETLKLVSELSYLSCVSAHIGYENIKDVEKIDKDTLFESLKIKGFNRKIFEENYHRNLTTFVRLLAFYAILEKENIDFLNLNNINFNEGITGGKSVQDILDSETQNLSEESQELLDALHDDFELSNISEEVKELIETYHNKYMEKNIYPLVQVHEVKEKSIIKFAKKLGK